MFLQIHFLTSYPASLLNRDDAGLAKRIPFGNAVRLRVSSQCLKRHWRENLVDFDKVADKMSGYPDGHRSRLIFEHIFNELRKRGISDEQAQILAQCTKNLAMKKSTGDSKEDDKESKNTGDLQIRQPIFLSRPEVEFLVGVAEKILQQTPDLTLALKLSEPIKKNDKLREQKQDFRDRLGLDKDNIEAMQKSAMGFTAALFGRMVISDLFARVDAPVHVAHAMTVHAANTEVDYFTVVDDLNREDETGSAHNNLTELGAGLYYGYVAVDVPLLVSNLTGCERKAWMAQDPATPRRVLDALINTVATQSPGAKKGSTAPYAYADFVMLEAGKAQPRSLANAFLDAVRWKDAQADLRLISVERLAQYLAQMDAMYGPCEGYRGVSSTLDPVPASLPSKVTLSQNIASALDAVFGG